MLSPAARPLPSRPAVLPYQIFNRYYEILELHVTPSKQRTAPTSNRYIFGLLSEPHGSLTAYNPPMALDAVERASQEKRLAALASVGSAVLLIALKIFLVVRTGSLGVLSEALHSTLDFVAAVITYLSVRVADKPADADHLYGHGKVESFSAFVETALLLFTAVYIIWEAFQRLLFHTAHMRPSLQAILVLALCMCIDLLGARYGIAWLDMLDAVAALGVAGVIIWIGSQLGKRTADALLDVAPRGLRERIESAVDKTEGVLQSERVRVRRAGQRYFVDVTISVPRTASLEQAHAASNAVEKRIAQIIPADVVVHVEPRAKTDENLFETIRAIAQRRGLAVHELSAHQFDHRLFIELHLEVDEGASLREAHRRASELEEDILKETDPRALVNIHIEPLGVKIGGGEEMKELARTVQDFLNSLQSEYHELTDCHEVHVRSVDHKILVSCHCAMDGNLPITEVHDITAALEDRVKERFPQIFRLTIHPEPVEES